MWLCLGFFWVIWRFLFSDGGLLVRRSLKRFKRGFSVSSVGSVCLRVFCPAFREWFQPFFLFFVAKTLNKKKIALKVARFYIRSI